MRVEVRSPEELTTIGIGAPRKVYIPTDVGELKLLLEEGFPVIGGGSNTVLSDASLPLISLEGFREIELKGDFLRVGAGVRLSEILKIQQLKGISLFEFLAGIPRATVGGLVAQNAGAFGREVKDFLYSVVYLSRESGEILELSRSEILKRFRYRSSPFPEAGVILSATFKVFPNKNIKSLIEESVKERLKRHPPFFLKTAGSTFKNPKGIPAGKLLDECGLRGFRLGSLRFSELHANFLINEGGAPYCEFSEIVSYAKERVKKLKGITLDLEVRVV